MITILILLFVFLALFSLFFDQFLRVKELKTAIRLHIFEAESLLCDLPEIEKTDLKCSLNELKKVL